MDNLRQAESAVKLAVSQQHQKDSNKFHSKKMNSKIQKPPPFVSIRCQESHPPLPKMNRQFKPQGTPLSWLDVRPSLEEMECEMERERRRDITRRRTETARRAAEIERRRRQRLAAEQQRRRRAEASARRRRAREAFIQGQQWLQQQRQQIRDRYSSPPKQSRSTG